MKKYIKTTVAFLVVLFVMSFQVSYIWGESPSEHPEVTGSSYSELMEYYNDKSKLKEEEYNPRLLKITFELYSDVYDFVIESDMFVYLADDLDKKTQTLIVFEKTTDGEFPEWIKWNNWIDDFWICITYLSEGGVRQQFLEEEGLKSYIQRYYSSTVFEGCDGCIRKYRSTETITLNGKECELFWRDTDTASIVYDNKIIDVSINDSLNGNQEDVRELIGKIIFSEYIPTEENNGAVEDVAPAA